MTSHRSDPDRRSGPLTRITRRRLRAGLAALPATVITACTGKPGQRPTPSRAATSAPTSAATSAATSAPPTPTRPTSSASATVTVTTRGITGGLADLAKALYSGKDVSMTAATAVLKGRRPPRASPVTVTGSEGRWRGTPFGILSHGDDLTFAVRRKGTWTVVAGRWPGLGIDKPAAGDKQFVLLIGSDARETEGESVSRSRGDSLHLCGVDGAGGAAIVGIPRDSWLDGEKINAAWCSVVRRARPGQSPRSAGSRSSTMCSPGSWDSRASFGRSAASSSTAPAFPGAGFRRASCG